MKTFHNPQHALHRGRQEMFRGRMVACHEVPERLDHVLQALRERGLGSLHEPDLETPGLDASIGRVHDPDYLAFLARAWDDWVALDPANAERDVLPSVWPLGNRHAFRRDRPPYNFAARVGQYAFDAGSPLMAGTWTAARAGAACALAAADEVHRGARLSFALTRPPGHHAGPDFFGGYCFLNNGAIAAQALRDRGCSKVAVLDIDYHHGNGTQTIFYERADVFTVSIHGDPRTEYPFFLGHADETGHGPGQGHNLNLPLPRGTGMNDWLRALDRALNAIAAYGPDALVVPMGMDTFKGDPISGFTLDSEDYPIIGRRLGQAGWPAVVTFEGGYAVAEVGTNAAHLLQAWCETH